MNLKSEISRFDSLSECLEFFRQINIFRDDIAVVYYFYYHQDRIDNPEDIDNFNNLIKTPNVSLYLRDEFKKIDEYLHYFQQQFEEYTQITTIIDQTEKINITEHDKKEFRNFYVIKESDGERISVGDIIEFFNSIEPNRDVQVFVLCNSNGKLVYKVSNIFTINYGDELLLIDEIPNTVTLFSKGTTKACKKTVFSFETGTCVIEINSGRMNDNSQYLIEKMFKGILRFEENNEKKIFSGELQFDVPPITDPFALYQTLMLDDFISYFFKVDERLRPWCVDKDKFDVIFRDPICEITTIDIVALERIGSLYAKVTFSSTNSKNFSIDFSAKSEEIIERLKKVLTCFVAKFHQTTVKNTGHSYLNAFYYKPLEELKFKSGKLFESENASSGHAFSTKCTGKYPIMIESEEVSEYRGYGRNVGTINFEGKDYHFTCISDDHPYLVISEAKVQVKSGNTKFPCCQKTTARDRGGKSQTNKNIKNVERINNYGSQSHIENGEFNEFFKLSFSTEGEFEMILYGTCFYENYSKKTIVNSFIGALILATGQYGNITSIDSFSAACNDVRRRLTTLPYDVFRQELYDISYETFLENLANPNHYIDPRLYYRGMEILFNVNIFVFARVDPELKKKGSKVDVSKTVSLELPRCKDYHTRQIRKDRNSVCIYKNHGTNRSFEIIPSCELIGVRSLMESHMIFKKENAEFTEAIWGYLERCSKIIYWEISGTELTAYSDPFTDWNPDDLGFGEVRGQEIGVNGRTQLLIYDHYNVVVPEIQPLILANNITGPDEVIATDKVITHNGIHYYVDIGGTKERAPLITKEQCMLRFVCESHDDEGCWIEFQGNKKGLKILCRPDVRMAHVATFKRVDQMVEQKNVISAILQIINWLWRSDLPQLDASVTFEEWFRPKIQIMGQNSFRKYGKPNLHLNNMYLPTLQNYEERMMFLTYIWPFFFRHQRIFLYEQLYLRILNLMKIQDKYTRQLIPENIFTRIPTFITDLIPTDEDFTRNFNMIFTKVDHLKMWLEYTNQKYVDNSQNVNMNIINSIIPIEAQESTNPFLWINSSTGNIFIIQNIKERLEIAKQIALEVAYIWDVDKRNHGPYANGITISDRGGKRYKVYKIDEDRVPRLAENNTVENLGFVSILQHTNQKYAAMLKIL